MHFFWNIFIFSVFMTAWTSQDSLENTPEWLFLQTRLWDGVPLWNWTPSAQLIWQHFPLMNNFASYFSIALHTMNFWIWSLGKRRWLSFCRKARLLVSLCDVCLSSCLSMDDPLPPMTIWQFFFSKFFFTINFFHLNFFLLFFCIFGCFIPFWVLKNCFLLQIFFTEVWVKQGATQCFQAF